MTSTIQLKLTYLCQYINVILIPIVGLFLAVLAKALVSAFTLGTASDEDLAGVGDIFIYASLLIALIYLVDTIGLVKKSNFWRWLSILLNSGISLLLYTSALKSVMEDRINDIIPIIVLSIIYLFPIYTLVFHNETKRLF